MQTLFKEFVTILIRMWISENPQILQSLSCRCCAVRKHFIFGLKARKFDVDYHARQFEADAIRLSDRPFRVIDERTEMYPQK